MPVYIGSGMQKTSKQVLEIGIKANAQEIVQLVCRYAESQVEEWRKVPHLALEADGRIGRYYFNNWFDIAYTNGLWLLPVSHSFKTSVAIHIDCDTGKLVDRDLNPLKDKYVLAAAAQIEDLDASRVIRELKSAAKAEHVDDQQADLRRKWREELACTLELEPTYRRTRAPKWDDRLV